MYSSAGGDRLRVVLLVSRRKTLASSLTAVLEPRGYRLHHASDVATLPSLLASDRLDVLILDEELSEPALDLIGGDQGVGGPELPILFYSAGSWSATDRSASARLHDAEDSVWDVVVEPIRSQDLLSRLERLHRLQAIWKSSAELEADGSSGFEIIVRGLPILDSIASRSDADIGCVVLGPTRPESGHREGGPNDRLAAVPEQIRGSDLHAWIGDLELVVILYGADVDGVGSFVRRIAHSDDRELSAGIAALEPPDRTRDGERVGSRPGGRLRALERIAAARRALDRAREAGGGVRVSATV